MLGIFYSNDICARHRISSKNVAHTWHSVSVMGQKQGFDQRVLYNGGGTRSATYS